MNRLSGDNEREEAIRFWASVVIGVGAGIFTAMVIVVIFAWIFL